jgi:hypothetical protein
VLKILPAIMAGSYVIEMISIFLGFGTQVLVNFIGMIVAPILFMYLASYVFKFCEYHRMFLHYLLITDVINIYDYHVGFPLDDLEYLCLHMIISGISLFTILYMYLKEKK